MSEYSDLFLITRSLRKTYARPVFRICCFSFQYIDNPTDEEVESAIERWDTDGPDRFLSFGIKTFWHTGDAPLLTYIRNQKEKFCIKLLKDHGDHIVYIKKEYQTEAVILAAIENMNELVDFEAFNLENFTDEIWTRLFTKFRGKIEGNKKIMKLLRKKCRKNKELRFLVELIECF